MASAGLERTGFSESSQVSMYNTYQNRVATAREAYSRAVLNYDNAIKDAMLQNNAALAEIAYQSLQQQLELSLQGFQYKNNLILEQANKKTELDSIYYNRYQDVLQQINTENAMAEDIRQYTETQKWQEEQNRLDREFQSQENELKRQFEAKQAEIDRQHEKDMLKAKTAAEKELLEIQHQNDIKKLNQQLANEKAALKYQYDLQKQSIGSVSGSSGYSMSSSDYYKKLTNDEKKNHKSSSTTKKKSAAAQVLSTSLQMTKGAMNAIAHPPIDMKSVTALGLGPIGSAELEKLESQGRIRSYVEGGKRKFAWVAKYPTSSLGMQTKSIPLKR
jgi:hypothetical protein